MTDDDNDNIHVYRGEALAPMVRASTTPLRLLALQYGADFCYTEELVDRSIFNTIRVENKELGTIDFLKDTANLAPRVQRRLQREGGAPLLLRIDPRREKGRLVCQIGSGEPELALKAAMHVHRDVTSIDINMGCPKKFSTSGGMGSALLQDPERASGILRNLATNLSLPVSAKIRLLPETSATLDLITALVERGQATAVAIHARRVGDQEIKPAQWDDLEDVLALAKAKFPHTKFLVNGDFYTRQEWHDFRDRTGVQGVLWARPALYNMSLFRKPDPVTISTTNSSAVNYGYQSPLLLDRTRVIQDYLKLAVQYGTNYKNVKYVVAEMMNTRRTPTPRVPYLIPPQESFIEGGQTIALTSSCHNMEDLCKLWKVDRHAHLVGNVTTAAEGEHRYDDSYILRMEQGSTTQTTKVNDDEQKEVSPSAPTAKRAKLEEIPVESSSNDAKQ